jgi:hypothetical protein
MNTPHFFSTGITDFWFLDFLLSKSLFTNPIRKLIENTFEKGARQER